MSISRLGITNMSLSSIYLNWSTLPVTQIALIGDYTAPSVISKPSWGWTSRVSLYVPLSVAVSAAEPDGILLYWLRWSSAPWCCFHHSAQVRGHCLHSYLFVPYVSILRIVCWRVDDNERVYNRAEKTRPVLSVPNSTWAPCLTPGLS